jgi:hypothetical protein
VAAAHQRLEGLGPHGQALPAIALG